MTLAKITDNINWNDLFYYDETSPSGLRNKIGRRKAKINEPSGWLSPIGYYMIEYKNVTYRCHRIIFEMLVRSLGENEQIDHINGVKSDNRLSNLRVVTASLNGKNRWVAKWKTIDGKQKHKYFKSKEEAAEYRTRMIESLNKEGAGYSDRHGL